MAKDPVCGMEVDKAVAIKKGLTVKKKGFTFYFCSQKCKNKFLSIGEPWYRSETFGKIFPWVLGVVLVTFAVLAFLFNFMLLYMGIFFIIFSLMKMPDWKGFVDAFKNYDYLAKYVPGYAWIYPGLEFVLGILFLSQILIVPAAIVTVIIFTIGGFGVLKNMLSKDQVQCACLGTFINVPLTKVTLLEDIIMVIMAIMILVL